MRRRGSSDAAPDKSLASEAAVRSMADADDGDADAGGDVDGAGDGNGDAVGLAAATNTSIGALIITSEKL